MKRPKKWLALCIIPAVLLLFVGFKAVQFYLEDRDFLFPWEKEEVYEGSKWEFDSYSFYNADYPNSLFNAKGRAEVIPCYVTAVGESAMQVYANEGRRNDVSSNVTDEKIGQLVYENGAITLILNSGEEITTARYFKDYLTFENGTVTFGNYSGGDEEWLEKYWEVGISDSFVKEKLKEETVTLGEYKGKKIKINTAAFPRPENMEYENAKAYITEGVLYVEIDATVSDFDQSKLTLVFKQVH